MFAGFLKKKHFGGPDVFGEPLHLGLRCVAESEVAVAFWTKKLNKDFFAEHARCLQSLGESVAPGTCWVAITVHFLSHEVMACVVMDYVVMALHLWPL